MFQEAIYTRCRYGLDITKNGQSIKGDGYKVYACSPSLYQQGPGPIGLPFLQRALESKQSFRDPEVMDDAYLYYRPEGSSGMLLDHHPVHFDPPEDADWGTRPGNVINQMFVGDFSAVYPYEFFGDRAIWDAQARDEAYYYHNEPAPLPERESLEPAGSITLDEIAAFVSAGRQQALAKAVAFLLEQYAQAPEKRRYLVIQDEDQHSLELWIAAIESAFSPRIAAGLPFATRMANLQVDNRYTVDPQGRFQLKIDLQDAHQSLRLRAMVVGYDLRLGQKLRALPNQPYVLLDGTAKSATFDADDSAPYFRAAAAQDEELLDFCREFLQTFGIDEPTPQIAQLFDAYRALSAPEGLSAASMAEIFRLLAPYPVHWSRWAQRIYSCAGERVRDFLKRDPVNAMAVVNWILRTAPLAGDDEAPVRLKKAVSAVISDALFVEQHADEARAIWSELRKCGFAKDISRYLTEERVIRYYEQQLCALRPDAAQVLMAVEADCSRILGAARRESLDLVTAACAVSYVRCGRTDLLGSLQRELEKIPGVDPLDVLLTVSRGVGTESAEAIREHLVDADRSVYASPQSLDAFCRRVRQAGAPELASAAMARYVQSLKTLPELDRFARSLPEAASLSAAERGALYAKIDAALPLDARGSKALAAFLQQQRTKGSPALPVSAHLAALTLLEDKRRSGSLDAALAPFVAQGFPSLDDEAYVSQLGAALVRLRLSDAEEAYLCKVLVCAPVAYLTEYLRGMLGVAEKEMDRWSYIIGFCNSIKDKDARNRAYNDLIGAMVAFKLSRKQAERLTPHDRNAVTYYNAAFAAAEKRLQAEAQQRGRSFLGSLFGRK